jgi:hypothetical protein
LVPRMAFLPPLTVWFRPIRAFGARLAEHGLNEKCCQ